MLAANGIFFQADLLRKPAVHQSRNAASKRLVPSTVLGVGPHDLDYAASRQVVRPEWLHNLSYRQERAQGVGGFFGRRRNTGEGIRGTRGTLRYQLKLAVSFVYVAFRRAGRLLVDIRHTVYEGNA